MVPFKDMVPLLDKKGISSPKKVIYMGADISLFSPLKDKSFAKKCDRNKITLCQDLNITLEDFLYLSLNALKDISTELGL